MGKRRETQPGANPADAGGSGALQPSLIVVTRPEAEVRVTPAALEALGVGELDPLARVLDDLGARLVPLFGPQDRVLESVASLATASVAGAAPELQRMSHFFAVQYPPGLSLAQLEDVAARLRRAGPVEAAYVKPAAVPAVFLPYDPNVQPLIPPVPSSTPDLRSNQGYLRAAPNGIDADYAHTLQGGRGEGVNVIDVEYDWLLTHEDLQENQGGSLGGYPIAEHRPHGTAVLGIIGADANAFGVIGISPDAQLRTISASYLQPNADQASQAIRAAADRLRAGDILLLELQRYDPWNRFLAVEWWEDDYLAIKYATTKGIIVVEAAGNGTVNLDDNRYDANPGTFSSAWRNPLRRSPWDSGAILVGAGNPPQGGDDANLTRCNFSNYGKSVDAQGWGYRVASTGWTGSLYRGYDERYWYANDFSGTSSASPIVTGALACLQGFLRKAGRPPLTPEKARDLLRRADTGTPQVSPQSGRIGNRPDLRKLVAALGGGDWQKWFARDLTAGERFPWQSEGWPANQQVEFRAVPGLPAVTLVIDQPSPQPGGTLTRSFTLVNNTQQPQSVEVQLRRS